MSEQQFTWQEKYDHFYTDGIYIAPRRRNWRENPPQSWCEIARVFKRYRAKNVLDIGCGNCAFQQWAEMQGFTCDGLEITREAFSRFWPMRSARGKPYRGEVQDMLHVERYPGGDPTMLSDGAYDAVRCMDILEHLPPDVEEARRAIAECARVCRKIAVFWSHTKIRSVEHPKYGNAHTLHLNDEQWFDLYAERFTLTEKMKCEGRKTIWFGTPKTSVREDLKALGYL